MYAVKRKIFFTKEKNITSFHCDDFEKATEFAKLHHVKLPSKTWLKKNINIMRRFEKYYDEIIEKCKPKLIIIECYYSLEGMALIRSAKKHNIKVADLQHGVQGSKHIAYADWKKIAEGYELLPDIFFVYSQTEADIINKWATLDKQQAIVIGDAWLEAWQNNKAQLQLPLAFSNCVKKAESVVPAEADVEILFSMDYGMPDKNIIKTINESPKNYFWWIRMHPICKNNYSNFDKNFRKSITHKNVNWLEATELPLSAILARINLHITYCSSITITCDRLGIPTIVETESLFTDYNLKNCVYCSMKKVNNELIRKVLIDNTYSKEMSKKDNTAGIEFIKNLLRRDI